MSDHTFPFTCQPSVPLHIQKSSKDSTFSGMEAGEVTWTSHWKICFCEVHSLYSELDIRQRNYGRSGESNIQIIRDKDGFVLDLTAIDKFELLHLGESHTCCQLDHENSIIFSGVFWPLRIVYDISYDPEIESFNREQLDLREKYSAYYEATYGQSFEPAGMVLLTIPDEE